MGKATGFLEYERVENAGLEPEERIKNYREFHTPLDLEERKRQAHAAWTVASRSVSPVNRCWVAWCPAVR